MNKTELIKEIAGRTTVSQEQTGKMIEALLAVVQETLADGDSVQLVGFGTFTVAERSERVGRNPKTGAAITIPAKKGVKFKPGKVLSDAVAA